MSDTLSSNQQELEELIEPLKAALPPEVLNRGEEKFVIRYNLTGVG